MTSPTRTLIDLAVTCDSSVLTAALDSALRDRLTTEEFLHRRIVDCAAAAGTESRNCSPSSKASKPHAAGTPGSNGATSN